MNVRKYLTAIGFLWAAAAIAEGAIAAEADVIRAAADALGGKEEILATRTLIIEGAGINPNVGQNVTPDAPLTNWKITGYRKTIDLANRRLRIQQRRQAEFEFSMFNDVKQNFVLDGDVAFNVDSHGMANRAPQSAVRERRIEMLDHPVAIVRAALDPKFGMKLNGLRTKGSAQVIDIATPQGDKLTLSIDSATHLPASLTWMSSSDNLGDIINQTFFEDYEQVTRLKLPKHFVTKIDFRNYTTADIRVSKNIVDGDVGDLSAPAAVRAAQPPPPSPVSSEAVPVAPHLWWLKGSGNHSAALYEFADHMTLFEAPASAAQAKAVVERARSVVPGKPLTEVIISHHHFDHTGGLRTMVAEGLTIISHKGNEQYYRELVARPATLNPDALAKNPKPLKFVGVEDHYVLKDKAPDGMVVELYRVKGNVHSTYNLVAWVPKYRIISQSDLFDAFWHRHLWGDNYLQNIQDLNLHFDKDVPVHGKIMTYDEEAAVIHNFDKTGRTEYTPKDE